MTGPPLRRGFVLARSTPFSYQCRACSRCCRGKVIPLDPYEVARLAEAKSTTTTEVLARWTTAGGAALAQREDGTCVFLGGGGCTVHAGRPLACRLYPLGRHLRGDGTEQFAELEPHPLTEGVYGEDGTIEDYLRTQDVERHVAAAGRYVALFKRMMEALAARPEADAVRDEAAAVMTRAPVPTDESLLDVDAMVSRWCAEHGAPVPRDVEEKTEIHVRAVEEYLDRM
jgi:Fe-S-cluster containining protein